MLTTDISPTILSFAAAAADEAGLVNVRTLEADGENLSAVPDGSVDAVISRVGLIYFPDRSRALAEFCRTLRPGGRISAIVYSTPDRNGFFAIPVGIIRRAAGLPAPAPGLPGPFSLGGPGVALEAFETAGLVDVSVTTIPSPVRLDSAAGFTGPCEMSSSPGSAPDRGSARTAALPHRLSRGNAHRAVTWMRC